jgi:hypothetical protein
MFLLSTSDQTDKFEGMELDEEEEIECLKWHPHPVMRFEPRERGVPRETIYQNHPQPTPSNFSFRSSLPSVKGSNLQTDSVNADL